MSALLYPLRGFIHPNQKDYKVLIIGPRTEDDIFHAFGLGFINCRGLDLFSYSPFVETGSVCAIPFPENSLDSIILGWVLPYLDDIRQALKEINRVVRPNGIVGIAWECRQSESTKSGFDFSDDESQIYQYTKCEVEDLVVEADGKTFCTFHSDASTSPNELYRQILFYRVG
jgi:SAM-dependent methyltransferase